MKVIIYLDTRNETYERPLSKSELLFYQELKFSFINEIKKSNNTYYYNFSNKQLFSLNNWTNINITTFFRKYSNILWAGKIFCINKILEIHIEPLAIRESSNEWINIEI